MTSGSSESGGRAKVLLQSAAVAIVCLAISGMAVALIENSRAERLRHEATIAATETADEINERLSRSLSATYALAAVIRQGKGEIEHFDQLAREMISLYGGISSLQLAPKGVIRFIVPLEGNEKAIGHNLLDDTSRNKEALQAVRTRILTLAGPFELVQGGVAVVGRLPVFLPGQDGGEEFWGFTTALIRIPELLKLVNIHRLIERGYSYELSRIHPDTGKLQVFARGGGELVSPVRHNMDVPNGHWTLSVSRMNGWYSTHLMILEMFAALAGSMFVTGSYYWLVSEPQRLRRMVDEHTKQLMVANNQLQREVSDREQAQREQQAAQEELRESEERYRSIIENMQDVFYRSDAAGHLTMLSPSGAVLLGYDSPKQMLGMVIRDTFYYDPSERDAFIHNLKQKGALSGYEVTLKRRDGSPVPVATSTHLLFDREGEFMGVEGVFRDISEQRTSDMALRASEEKFSRAFSKAPLLMSISDIATGRYQEVNERFCEVSGFTPEEVLGRTSIEIGWLAPTEREQMVSVLTRDGRIQDMELTLTAKDGRTVVCLYSAEIICVDGEDRLLSIALDITDRKQTEMLLRESEERYRILFNAESDAIVVVDVETLRHIDVNESASEMYGYTREELLTMGSLDLSAEPDETRRCITEGQGLIRIPERRHRKKDGTIFPVEITARFFEYGGRRVLLAAMRDISEIQQLHQEREKSQRLESLGVLAGGIAHDFNNILTGIIGNLSLARSMAKSGANVTKRLEQCEKAALRASDLTKQLLTFARGGEPVKKVIDTPKLINEAVSFALHGTSVKGDVHLPAGLWCLEADAGQLSQVLNNLLINAVQAMPGGGTVTITAENVPDDAGERPKARIVIADTGEGIPSDVLPYIFDPYFTTKNSGTGLGLASAYSIVTRHGGSISVASEPGRGTEFILLLPAIAAEYRTESVSENVRPTECPASRILLMDDEEMILDVAGMMLTEIGCQVDTCNEGSSAVALYRTAFEHERRYDLVILDLTVPGGMGGVEAARHIRAIDPHAVLIVSSGYSHEGVSADYGEYGFDGAVLKPYSMSMLISEIERVTANARGRS